MCQSISEIKIRLLRNRGFTLMELVAVIVIMGIVATVALRSMDKVFLSAKVENTKLEMDQIVNSITGNPDLFSNGVRTDFGYVGDVGSVPLNLDYLLTDVGGYATWSGPYIQNDFSEAADGYKRDAWGDLYTYNGVTIQSSGGGSGTMTKQICSALSDLTSNTVNGTISDAAGNPPGDSAMIVSVTLQYPDGAGGLKDTSVGVASGGSYAFNGTVPIGNHLIRAIYSSTSDTVSSYISVMPGHSSVANLRFPGALWAASGGGGGGQPTTIQYVYGTASCPGSANDEIQFNVINSTGQSITVTWIKVTYQHTPTAYYTNVRWQGQTVFQSTNPRKASGETTNFSSAKSINPGQTRTIRIRQFRNVQSGSGSAVSVANTDFTVEFSNGAIITFNSGT